jgi:hypothetical protein
MFFIDFQAGVGYCGAGRYLLALVSGRNAAIELSIV